MYLDFLNRFNDSDFENGYSRNLLWRLWHASRALEMEYLHEKCTEVSVTVISSKVQIPNCTNAQIQFLTDITRNNVRRYGILGPQLCHQIQKFGNGRNSK